MTWEIRHADALAALRSMPAESVQTCVTSPPYFGHRAYPIPPVVWGGDPGHAHGWGESVESPTLADARERQQGEAPDEYHASWPGSQQHVKAYSVFCSHSMSGSLDRSTQGQGPTAEQRPSGTSFGCGCGAWLGQLGNEPTPWLYVEHIVEVMREVRRVLKPDGTLWLVLGDSYAGSWGSYGSRLRVERGQIGSSSHIQRGYERAVEVAERPANTRVPGLAKKQLIGVPWRVAFALQEDGWWLRRPIVWAKPNVQPESTKDRPTVSHETIFLLSKRARYKYRNKAVQQPLAAATPKRVRQALAQKEPPKSGRDGHNAELLGPAGRSRRPATVLQSMAGLEGANLRDVWWIATVPYGGKSEHFGTFPPELPRRCILLGSDEGDTVLDPFSGLATTGLVANRHGRDYIGIEPCGEYVVKSKERIASDAPLLNQKEGGG